MFFLKLKDRSSSVNKISAMKRQSVDSSMTSTDSQSLSNTSSRLSSQTLVAPEPKRSKGGKSALPDYAEMLEDENMSWGPPKPRRR